MSSEFRIDAILDVDKFIKANYCKEITNPVIFSAEGVPTNDGLLSNEIFGNTRTTRASIFAYIKLNDTFLHPLVYKIWSRMDSRIHDIVWTDKTYSVDSRGEIIEDENGESGIKFLKKNINKIKIRSTESKKREINIKFIESNKERIFIDKIIVIPAFYRDALVKSGKTEIGELNQMYQNVLRYASSLASLSDFGIGISHLTRGRLQEELLNIYNWFPKEPNIGQKKGIIRRAVLSKTVDYSPRLILTAPNLQVESPKDFETTMDYASIPLTALCSCFKPFLIFHLRNYFRNLYNTSISLIQTKDGHKRVSISNFEAQFNDEEYEHQISNFVESYSKRYVPIQIKTDSGDKIALPSFRKQYLDRKNEKDDSVYPYLTWCELFYVIMCDICKTRAVLITRFPIDSHYSQFPCKVNVITTINVCEVEYQGEVLKNYPAIQVDDVKKSTSGLFRETVTIFNPFIGAILADYDGDQVKVVGVYTDEANAEIEKYMQSKLNYIDLGGEGIRTSSNETIQALYNLTLVLPDDKSKLNNPKF